MCNAVQQCLAANNILLMRKGNWAFLLLAIAHLKMADHFASQGYSLKKQTWWSNDKTIYWTRLSQNIMICQYLADQIIYLSLRLRQIIDLLAKDKSWYFAQPRPIIVNYSCTAKYSWLSKKSSLLIWILSTCTKCAYAINCYHWDILACLSTW